MINWINCDKLPKTDLVMDRKRRLLTPEEIAEELQIPKSTIYKLCSEGEIPAAKIGKHWRFDRSRLDAWLESRFEGEASPEAAPGDEDGSTHEKGPVA